MTIRLRFLATLIVAFCASIPAQAAASLADAAGRYAISQSGSKIRFAIGQIDGGGLQGAFGQFSGTISIDGSNIGKSRVDLTIYPASVTTGKARVDTFLKSNAVFDTANEKQIVFRSTSVKRTGDASAVVTGRLTARGKSSNETFTVSLESFAKSRIVFHVTGKVLRSRYNMDVGTPIYSNVVDFDMRFDAKRN